MQDLQMQGVRVKSIDVTDEHRLKETVDEILAEHGQIDGLINNAGINIFGSLEETPAVEARRLFDLNVFAYARLTQLVLPHMRTRRSGFVVNVGSLAGFIVLPTNGWYCASKFALEALTDALRMEVRPLGIKVVLIEPEVINTDIGTPALLSLIRYVPIEDYTFFTSKWTRIVPSSINRGAPPELVAKTIFKALQTRKPRARYFVPSYSKVIPFLKKVLPDKWVDRLTIFILTQLAKRS
jgi:short-subunit dehydrogenase